MNLDRQVAIVTDSGRGIGRAIVQQWGTADLLANNAAVGGPFGPSWMVSASTEQAVVVAEQQLYVSRLRGLAAG